MLSSRLIVLFGFLYTVLREETLCNDSATNPEADANSKFTQYVMYENQVLDAPIIVSYQVRGSIECALRCSRHSSCFSFNIEADEERKPGASLLCELLPTDKLQQSPRFGPSGRFHHYSVYTPCLNFPCANGGTCIPDYHRGLYNCSCPPQYEGKNCQLKSGPLKPGTFSKPGFSCKDILDKGGHSLSNGEYWIEPHGTGNPFTAYCDMTTDGGGWTLLRRVVLPHTTLDPSQKEFVSNAYTSISNYSNIYLAVTNRAIQRLREAMPFHQLRWYCFKKTRGRVFHVATKNNTAGKRVLDSFLRFQSTAVACGSFIRLPDDNSTISQYCNEWGPTFMSSHMNKWGSPFNNGRYRIYRNVSHLIGGRVSFSIGFRKHFYCDDRVANSNTPGDTWEVYAR